MLSLSHKKFPYIFFKNYIELILIVVLWSISFWELHFEWAINQQYNYGFFIPFLSLYLFYLRWEDRPNMLANHTFPTNFIIGIAIIITYIVSFLFLANVDWRPLHFLQAFAGTSVSFSILYRIGGWPWVKHFGFPILFLWVSIPWPRFLEKELINNLMDTVAYLTVDILNLSGIYASQQGSAIILKTGAVNVAEACSGVRSFQSTLMGGLFLGELFRLPFILRGFLIILACFFAGFFNITRTLGLTWIANITGPNSLNHWHDPAGYLVFFMSFGLLFLLSLYFKKYTAPKTIIPFVQQPNLNKTSIIYIYTILLMFSLPISYMFYNYQSKQFHKQPLWNINWQKSHYLITLKPLDPSILSVLMCDDSIKAEWETSDGKTWFAYYMAWNSAETGQIGGLHSPGNCLPSVGWQMITKADPIFWNKDNVQFIICPFVFHLYDKEIFVFDVQWDPSGYPYYKTDGLRYYKDRFLDAFQGNRKNHKRTLEFIGENYPTLKHAINDFIIFLEKTITIIN